MYSSRPSFFQTIPPVVKNLLIINVLIWLLMALLPAADRFFDRYLALYYFTSPAFQPFQLFTYMFLHGGFAHLFFNMFALLMFGRTIEMTMGSARFLFYYITCGICAALVQMGVFAIYINSLEGILPPDIAYRAIHEGFDLIQSGYNYSDPDLAKLNAFVNTPMVGASGAIYGIVGYFVLELVYGMSGSADGVAHFAHLGGMIFGFLLLLYWKKKGVFSNHWFF